MNRKTKISNEFKERKKKTNSNVNGNNVKFDSMILKYSKQMISLLKIFNTPVSFRGKCKMDLRYICLLYLYRYK